MEHTNNLNLFKYNTATDGSQVFDIDKALNENWDKIDNLFAKLYPVGAIYLSVTTTCPLEGVVGHWELVSSGRALWGGSGNNADTTIAAGLPNITGSWRSGDARTQVQKMFDAQGAFYGITAQGNSGDYKSGWSITDYTIYGFDASRSNSIYGKSTTVQPPAYVVNVWKRIS